MVFPLFFVLETVYRTIPVKATKKRPGGAETSYKSEMTLDYSFLSDSRNFFV